MSELQNAWIEFLRAVYRPAVTKQRPKSRRDSSPDRRVGFRKSKGNGHAN